MSLRLNNKISVFRVSKARAHTHFFNYFFFRGGGGGGGGGGGEFVHFERL